jgi:hypothetical protein
LPDAIAAVRDGKNDPLPWRGELAQELNGLEIHRIGSDAITVTERCPDQRGKRNDDVGRSQEIGQHAFVPAIAPHHLETLLAATIHQTVLAIHEIIQDGDLVTTIQ